MESIFKLGIVLSVADLGSRTLQLFDNNIKSLVKNAGKLGPTFDKFQSYGRKVAVGGALMMSVLAGTATAYAGLEEAQLGLTTQIMTASGQVGPELIQLNQLAEQLGSTLPGSARDILDMFTALREQGVQTNVILGGMGEAAAKFSVLMKVSFAEGATHVAKFCEALGIADRDSVQFMDTLQRLKGAAGVNVGDLSESIKYAGASLKALRIQGLAAGHDVSAAIGLMATSSIEGSQAGTGLAMALSRMAEISSRLESKKIAQLVGPILDAKGIKLNFFDEAGNFVGIRNMIGELEKLRSINPQEQLIVLSKLFGQEAARPLSVFINQGVAGFDAMGQKMTQQADMQKKIDVIMAGIGMRWETLTGTTETFVMHIGAAVAKVTHLGTIMDWINRGISAVDGFMTAYPNFSGAIATVVVVSAVLATVLGAVFTAIGLIGLALPQMTAGFAVVSTMVTNQIAALQLYLLSVGGVTGALKAAALASWGFAKALLANPITWIVIGVVALIAGLVWLYRRFEAVRTAVAGFLFVLGYILGAVWKFKAALLFLLGPIGMVVGAFFLLRRVLSGVNLFESGAKIIGTLVAGIKSMAMAPVNAVIGIFQKVRELLPFSDAKTGPLSQLTLSGARIMETLGTGVQGAAPGLHKTMRTALAGAALATSLTVAPPPAAAMPTPAATENGRAGNAQMTSSGRTITIQNLTVTLPGVSDADGFMRQLQALVEGHDAG